MKKIIVILIALFLTAFNQSAQAQTASASPWNGPRWTSVNVTETVWDWIEDNGHMPQLTDTNGEWVKTNYTYMGKSVWMVVITWGIGGFEGPVLGTETLLIKNNGHIISS